MDVLTIQGLEKRFGEKQVLKGLELCVPPKSIFGFIGANGAGKTTTMKLILGLLAADAGEIHVCGERVVYGETKTNQSIGYLPDVPAFYDYMTAKEYLHFCGEMLGMPRAEIIERSAQLLEMVGLFNETHRIKGYSRGMKQRLGIAQALLHRPKLLICDEPTSALDPLGRKEVLDILQAVKEETTVVFSTHILSDVEKICTDAAILKDGHIVMQGSVSALKAMRTSDEFYLVPSSSDDIIRILTAFGGEASVSGETLVFQGDEEKMFEVLKYLTDHRIPISKIERCEPSLESLFLEVSS
ncbi:MAG: ABC transporter ATP-binding protein [Clostridia bacterium]|nr:ABC transporter ATP-binding protein [Clostridia bacterium]